MSTLLSNGTFLPNYKTDQKTEIVQKNSKSSYYCHNYCTIKSAACQYGTLLLYFYIVAHPCVVFLYYLFVDLISRSAVDFSPYNLAVTVDGVAFL